MPGRSGGRGGSQPPAPSKHLKTPASDKQTVKEDGRDTEPAASPQQEEKIDKKEDWYEEAMANAERDLAEDAEWKRIQENTFTRWVNEHLRQAGTSINDLETDFSNGLKLIALLEVLSGKKMPKHNKKPTFRSQKLENVSIALKFLETEGVHLVNIDSTHITDCKLKLIMGLIWTLILHYSISMPMYDGPELGGHIEDKTPKQRLLNWMQNKVPGVPINNFTSDWTDGIKVGALVDSVAPGLCPDWEDWDPNEPIRNATEAMDLADNWLGVPKLLTPEEIVNPNVDEQSMMTYLSQFPNAKVKEGAPFREKALASKVRAFGPGLEPTGNVAKAPAKFTVETFGAGDGELNITVKGPDGTDYKVDKTYNNDRKKSYSCSYFPDKEGDFTVPILFAGRNIPKSPYNVAIEGFAGDANKVTVAGPGVEPEGVVANRPTDFDIFTAGAGRGKPEVIVLDPHGLKDAIPVKITPSGNDVYHCEYLTNQLGVHSVNVFFAGNPIPDSPFGVRVGPASNPGKVHASGRGLQPHGVRAQELVDFKVFTEGAGEGVAGVKIIGPGGVITPTTARNIDPHTIEYKYTPERDGRYRVMITWAGKEIPKSPFEVNVSPLKSSKIKAFGPGLKGGVVDLPALFTVDTCGETGSLGFSIEGPSQAKINCNDNGDGSADVDYVPTVAGEYAVHILCDNEDIPGSPYMAQILPKSDYDPGQVKCYGPGLEEVVQPNEETHFTIDSTKAGKAPLDVLFMDDYGEVKPLWKDENGIQDPKDGGILAVKIIRAKELIKTDLIGKSDPYAVIKHGAQKFTTKVVKNSLEPEWNYEAQVTIPDQGDNAVTIELFDSDKIGKDKSLGSITFNTSQVVREKVIEQGWYSLQGVNSGQLLMSADFVSAAPTLAKDARPEHQRKMSHKNLDVRRPVLEKKSEGMYECTYTPRKTQKLVICVNYGGVAVPGSPFRVTVDDPTDPNKVKVYGPGVEDGNKTGKPVDFTVDCKEAGPGDLEINITDDKDQEVPITVNDKGDHTFNVIYNPKKNGAHTIEVKYDGRDVPQSPITVNVKTDIDMRKIKVLGLEDEVFVDCTNDFEVDTSSLPANVTPNIGCAIKCPDGTNLKDLRVDQPGPDGKAKVSYTPSKEGKHEVNVTCDGDPINGSPFKVKAKKGFDPKKVKAYGPGLEKGICHEPNQFTIETRNAGKGDLGLSIEGPAEAKMTCKDNRDGSCNVDYVPTVPGNYDVTVKLEDKNIPGSPFKVPVVDLSRKESEGKLAPLAGQSDLPNGKLKIKVIKAKELIKADLIGKSDPYAVIKYGQQHFKTETVKNSLEPKWDYELEMNVPESHYTEVSFQVFDADKMGKDKSLGSVNVNIAELAAIADTEGRWFPLTGVKSGQILLSADFLDLAEGGQGTSDPTKEASNTKASDQPQSQKSPLPKYGKLPPGRARVFLVKGKELIKTDLIGKVDPYATLSYGTQTCKTQTIKNSQEPKWDYCANFEIPEGDKRNVIVEVLDSDKLGKDKSLGKVELDLADLVNNEDAEGHWYPLIGVKSGKVLLFADFEGEGTFNPEDSLGGAQPLKSKLGSSPDGEDGGDGADGAGGPGQLGDDDDEKLPTGVAKINLIKAADLIKSDMIGKSDPYAVLSHGNQKDRTKTVNNTQNPEWNHRSEFDFPDADCRTFDIEVFDADKFGKDKSLGKVTLDIADILNESENPKEGKWYPLEGVKSGKVLLNADFLDDLGRRPSEILKGLLKDGDPRKGSTTSGLDSKSPSDSDGAGDKKKHPSALNGDVPHVPASALPTGKAKINLIKAKELIQADRNSKSDPYAMLLYGRQVEKTKVVQNSHEPQWNHEAEFDFPEGDERTFRVEVFDSDKVGKDTSLGHLDLDITDVLALDGQAGKWFALSGVPSGKVLLSADFIDDLGRKAGDILDNLLKGLDADGRPCRKSSSDSPAEEDSLSDRLPSGTATINLIKAKNLMKLDPREKTHPYAVLIHGRQMEKTKTIKNTTEPLWDHKADFRTPDGNSREFCIEVFDSEKYGKDNSLGSLSLDIVDVLKMDGQRGQWFPLDGATSGEILLSANFFDDLGRSPEEVLKDLLKNDNERKKSGKPLNRAGSVGGSGLGPDDGVAKINIIKAKDLVKSDLIGKSDPYAVIKYGTQKDKTPVVKNSQNPEWNHTTELKVPEDDANKISIEVFDQDRIGKDKSLGKIDLDLGDLQDLADVDGAEGRWFPLEGVKSGQILLSGDLLGPDQESDLVSAPSNVVGNTRNKSLSDQGPNDGKARVNLIKAKDLIKTDLKGKSDPYAVVKYGSQKFKTPTVKNSQDPEWDCEMEFDFPEEGGNNFNIEVFDEDTFGKDKSLGRVELSPASLAELEPQAGYWLPLTGVKSGEVLLSAQIADSFPDDDDNINPLTAKSSAGRDDPQSVGAPPQFADQLPEGQLGVKLLKAKDLVKSDVFGKSDPYAILSFGQQKDKTPVAKNTQNPVWNHESQFGVPDGPDQTLNIEVFDSDKIGKDKSLGKLDIDVEDLLNNPEDNWYPLSGVKSGQVLLSSDFLPLDGLADDGVPRKRSSDLSSDNKGKKKPSIGANGSVPEGVVHLELVKAKDLEDGDKKSKSDPYAVLKYGKQKAKTNTIKNTQNPQWNFETDFNVPDGKDKTISVEVLDNDRFGRDKSLGKLDLDVGDLLDDEGAGEGRWYPLEGSKSGQVLIASSFLRPEDVREVSPDKAGQQVGGKGTGAADPSKVLAYGPGLEKGKVMPGRPASFTIDSSKTGPAPIEVTVESEGAANNRKPSMVETGPGKHDVTYVPPPVGKPYQVGVKYGGEDVPGSPFEMSSNADTSDVIGDSSGAPERKGSKIGISVNPDDAHNLGKIHVGLIAAKDLVKSDIMGKSDPYAILSHGNQKFKTDTAKNTQNPEFNYDALFNVPDDGDDKIKIDLLDSDRFGKDKSLGKLDLDVDDIMTKGIMPPTWFPLKGAKSGQVLVSADFEASDSSRFGSPERNLQGIDGEEDGQKSSAGRDGRKPSDGRDGRDGRKPSDGRKSSKEGALGLRNRLLSRDEGKDEAEDFPEGTLHVDVLGARNLPKSDLIGKSDPYAEIGLGDQKFKTPTAKNTQNPEWNFGADFDLDGDQPADVLLAVFDKDKFGGDKPLGTAAVPVSDLLERSEDPNAGPTWVPLAGVKSGELLVDTNFTPGDEASRRGSGHGTGKFRSPSKQGSSASLLGDDDRDGKNGKGGADGLRDKMKNPKALGEGVSEDLIPGNLHLNLHKAEGLVKGDILGKSDPYAVVSFDGEKHQTKTVKNNQNPEWNFELDVPVDEEGPHDINIDVFDKDKIGRDKLLGSTQLSVPDLQSEDLNKEWLPLDGAKSGKVQVSTDFTPEGLGDKPGQSDLPAGNVHLALHEAEGLGKGDLIGKSDPYAVVKYDDDEVKTKTIKNNQNPEWNFETDLPVQDNGPRNIDIEVYDSDRFGKDKLLGSTSLDIGDMMDAPFNEEWLPLDGSKNGKIKVSADFNPLDELGNSSRKTSRLEESYSRKSSTTSEVYSRKSSEVFSRKTSTLSDVTSRKESQVSTSGSRRESEVTVSGSRRQSEMSVTSSRRQSEMALSGSRRPSGMKNLDDEDGARRPSQLADSGSRKTSGASGMDDDSEIPGPGTVNVNVHGAKDLMKKDLIGKSDPYAVLSYGGEQVKSDPVKNTQNPQWEFMAQLPVDENSPDHFNIEIFDKDKFGKDKSLGKADIDLPSIANGQSLDRDWIPLDGVKSGMIQVSADYDPDDPSLASRKSSQGGAQHLADQLSNRGRAPDGADPSNDRRKGSHDDPHNRHGSRKGSQFNEDDPSNGRGSRKGSQDPSNRFGDRKGSQDDPSNRFGGRKGSQDDPSNRFGDRKGSQDDPSNRYGDRKGSQDDPSNRYGSRKGSQDDPSNRYGDRRGSQDDPSNRYGDRRGSKDDPSNRYGDRKGSQDDPSNRYGDRKGSQDDPSNRFGGRKGSQEDPTGRYGERKGSQDDPSNRYGSRKGSQDDPSNRYGDRRGSQDEPSNRTASRKGSHLDDDDVEWNNRRNSKHGGPDGASQLRDDIRRGKSFSDISEGDVVPIGNVHLEITQAKNLVKADMIGKSDPYAVVSYGDESMRTKTVKNNLNPEWNFEADIPVDPNGPRNIQIDLFDDDKLGKDKPLGSADIDIPALINNATLKDSWIPLSGVKSGHIQVSADFAPYDESSSRKPSKSGGKLIPEPERDGMRNRGGSPGEDDGFGSSPNQRKASDNKQAPGLIHLNIVQAKDLIKTDILGKSDPFAVLTYGDEQIKTNTIKNNQNPQWNFEADIPYNPNYSDTIKVEIFDDDKLGKNKPLGSAVIDIPSLANNDPLEEVWLPLDGVKSGQVQVSAEYVPTEAGPDQYRQMSPIRDSGALGAPRNAKGPIDEKLGTIKLDLLMAKDLIKTDLVGKSDPYAIISHGDQKFKSDIKKNTQNPEWNIECEIGVPDGHDRNISIELYDSDKFGKDKFLGKLNLDIAKIMNLGKLEDGWYPLDGVKQGQIRVGADFIPELDESSTIVINQRLTETRRTSTQFQEVNLNRIPLPSTGGSIDASIRRPSGAVDLPSVQDDNNGTVAIKYQPTEEGTHYLDVRYNNDHVQGSPFKFHVTRPNNGQASAYGPGLTHGVCGEQANFTVSTKGAGAGGLHLAVEGPSKADITCHDNKDGTVDVSYLPTAPGEYKITAKFADDHIPGSPFTCKITGEGKKRNQISVGSSSELQLPGNLTETDLRSLKAYIESPSGAVEQCFLKKLPRGNIGISFTPREVGEHLVSVQKNGKHITNSPFKIIVNSQEVGDASRVVVSGAGLVQGKTHVHNRFMINTKSAGYGGLSLSIEGPSKAEIDCKDNEDGTLDVDYKPTEPGFYIINIKFADSHVPGSPFQVPISGEGSEKMTENIKRMREAVPVTEVGSQCRLTFKMPGISVADLDAMVTSPSGKSTKANVSEEEEGLYAVNFVPYELGIHTVTVRYRDVDIPGSPFQFTVGPLQDSGAHRVHAGGPGLARGVEGEPAEFNVWTREAGPGSLAISVEGPSKAQIEFLDRKDGSCYVSYVVDEAGEYSVGIRFNEQHIPDSPYKVFIIPKSDHADKVKISNLDDTEQIALNAPQSFLLSKNGASGTLQCKMVSPTGREDDCFMSQVGPDEYSVRFVPKEEGYHHLHAKLNGVHVPGSPFKIKVGGEERKDGAVKVYGLGLDRVKTGEKAAFVIDTSNVGAGTLSVTVDGPSKVDMDCNEVSKGYEVSYTPTSPGDYYVTVKYNGKNVDGSPFKVTVGGGGASGTKSQLLSRRESSSVTMETIQRTMIRQESAMFQEVSRTSSRPIPIQPNFKSDGSAVTCKGPGIDRPTLGKQNSFSVDCSHAGNNVLFVGIYGPEKPCDEVYVKHQGDRSYGVSYKLSDPGQYILYVKWGDEHAKGSPFHIQV